MKTILFADDKPHIREHCRRELEYEGYRVFVARDGAEAVRLFADTNPDAVVLDISMPYMNGLEALERVKAIKPEVPVILFTAYDEDCVHDPRGALAEACVEKSADLAELKRRIECVLRPRSHDCPEGVLGLGLPSFGCAVRD